MTTKIVVFEGGVGNKLYQLALFHALWKIDQSRVIGLFLDEHSSLFFEFLKGTPFSDELIKKIEGQASIIQGHKINWMFRFIRKLLFLIKKDEISSFDGTIFRFASVELYWGYWQTGVATGANVLDLLGYIDSRKFFALAGGSNKNRKVAGVTVHVRRGDYLNKKNKYVFQYLDDEYYSKAVDIFVSSCQVNIVTESGAQPLPRFKKYKVISDSLINDFLLLATSKNLVIANSTFSLWAGLISSMFSGSIVAPKIWYVDIEKGNPAFLFKDRFVFI